jgi:hypothetical protein
MHMALCMGESLTAKCLVVGQCFPSPSLSFVCDVPCAISRIGARSKQHNLLNDVFADVVDASCWNRVLGFRRRLGD